MGNSFQIVFLCFLFALNIFITLADTEQYGLSRRLHKLFLRSKLIVIGDRTTNRERKCSTKDPSAESKEKMDNLVQKYLDKRMRSGFEYEDYTIPVYWHVIHSGDKGKLTPEEIETSMNVLNEAFRGSMETYPNDCNGSPVPSGVNTNITFDLIDTDFTDDDYYFTDVEYSAWYFAPNLHKGEGCKALNIYTGDMWFGKQGYATFPFDECNKDQECLDGVYINYKNLAGGSDINFSEGDVLVHEVGHWLGLFHTFENGCFNGGDDVDDTPFSFSATEGCPSMRDSCRFKPGNDPIHNFMDYSDDCCIYEFTERQAIRMQAVIRAYRS